MNPPVPAPSTDLVSEGLRIKLMLSAAVAVWFSAVIYFVHHRPTNKTTRRSLWAIILGIPAVLGGMAFLSARLGG